jgi:oligopeptide/dipeptide ABC transporter ATP-binding protein
MDLSGEVADPGNLPPGCSFHPRCAFALEACKQAVPELIRQTDGRTVACIRCGKDPAGPQETPAAQKGEPA